MRYQQSVRLPDGQEIAVEVELDEEATGRVILRLVQIALKSKNARATGAEGILKIRLLTGPKPDPRQTKLKFPE